MMRFKVSSFEILKNTNQSSGESIKQLSGLFGIDDEGTYEAIQELCSKESIEKVIILYHDYAFSLLGVSFTADTNDSVKMGGKIYKFQAQDVHLEALAA